MKKHLMIIALLALMMPLSAETLSICKTFEKLLVNVNDFKPLMVEDNTESILSTPSIIQLEGAKSTKFSVFSGIKFVADLGSFQTRKEASDKYTEWKNALKACYPGMNFSLVMKDMPDLKAEFRYFYPFIVKENTIRLYEANFCISKTISTYDLSFNFPQVQKASLSGTVPAYTDFTLITQEQVDSPFGKALSELFMHAMEDFAEITGDISLEEVSSEALAYDVTFKLPGYASCLIERNTSDQLSYVVNLCSNVDKATFETTMSNFIKQVMSAMGNKYAYKTSANGKSIRFVPADGPTDTVASFSYTEKDGKYSARFTVYAIEI